MSLSTPGSSISEGNPLIGVAPGSFIDIHSLRAPWARLIGLSRSASKEGVSTDRAGPDSENKTLTFPHISFIIPEVALINALQRLIPKTRGAGAIYGVQLTGSPGMDMNSYECF